ncbi:MAG: FAD-binding oxidoreductase [Solirubrobacteraceae bacterium]
MSVHRAPKLQGNASTSLHGKLLSVEHPEFDHARRAWNLAVDQRPAAIISPTCVEDVMAAVATAQELGLRVAPQGTGHGAAALGSLEDTILLKTDRLREIHVDQAARVVRVEAGVTWGEAVEAAGHHGLALLAGSSPDVGVVGYTLGGGLSWISRKHGLACNSLEAAELVSADGSQLRVDSDHEPELFWALRGGGGNFGVVTAIELRALSITDVYAGLLWWPIERGEDVLHRWRELTQSNPPDELTTIGRYLQMPQLPEIPEPLRGRSFVVVEVFHLGDPAEADELLAPLRALAPELDTIDIVPAAGLGALTLDPDHPVPVVGDGTMLAELPPAAVDELVRVGGDTVSSPLLSVEIRHLGGELARSRAGHGALSSIDAPYAMFSVGIAPTEYAARGVRAYLDRLHAAMAPWTAPTMYMNFAETSRDPAALWSEHRHRRLGQIKARFDPDDLMRANHPVKPA